MFKPFSQADKSINRQYGGTGLGLAISKRLAEIMDGEIGVESSEGLGSNFWFTVTLSEGFSNHVNYWYDLNEIRAYKIFLVTDNIALESSFSSILKRHGISLHIFNNLSELEGAKDNICDLLFSDKCDFFDIPATLKNQQGKAPKFIKICEQYSKHKKDLIIEMEKVFTADKLMVTILKAFNSKNTTNNHKNKNAPTQENNQLDNLKVLVAEDNAVNQKVIVKRLHNFGIVPHVVENGEEAVKEYITNHREYDLILMDCEMPILDGYEATHKIRDFEKRKHVKPIYIVALSANALEEQVQQGMTSGMDDYLTKPAKKEELLNILNKTKLRKI